MSATKRRLDKLEASLSPKPAIIMWMGEAHEHGDLPTYVKSLEDKPESTYPLYRLPEQVEQSVRAALKGVNRDRVWAAVRVAVRDVVFLFHLHQQVNTRCMADQKAHLYRLRWLRSELRALHHAGGVQQSAVAGERVGRRRSGMRKDMTRWRDEAEQFLVELYSLRSAADAISARYFDGHTQLFPDVADTDSQLVAAIETLVETFNDNVATSVRARVDLDFAQTQARGEVGTHVESVVVMAKAEALDFVGNGQAGITIVKSHVWRIAPN